jgi:hypothetical protein
MLVVPAATDLAAFYDQRYGPEALPDTAPDTIRSSHVAPHVRSIEARLYGNVGAGGREVIVVGQDFNLPALGDSRQPSSGPKPLARSASLREGRSGSAGRRSRCCRWRMLRRMV